MMIFPALVYVFEELKQENGIDNYSGRNWYVSLSKAYEKRGVDLEDELLNSDKTSVQLAQEAMEGLILWSWKKSSRTWCII